MKSSKRDREIEKNDLVTIVVPTLNEAEAIGKVIDEIRECGFKKILVVDGYSTDDTVKIAEEKGAKVVFQYGEGKAGAIRTAIDLVDTPYMLVMDGDLTYDPRDIKRMLNYMPRYDEIIGMRTDRHNIPLVHRIGNRIISLVFSLLMGQRISDPCSGMYLLKTDVARNLELSSRGFDVEVEIAAQISSLGRVIEIPIKYRKRVGRKKLSTWRDGFNILMTILKMLWLYNPVFLFSALAAVLTFPGLGILLWQLYIRYLYGAEVWSIGWTWLGLVLLVIGLQGLTLSVISLLLKRLERRVLRTLSSISSHR